MVSIVIRTRNEAYMLNRCLTAIDNQDYRDFEVIIVEDHSTDNTVEVARRHNAKVVEIEHFTYGGAINIGIENSEGEYIVILSGHCIPTNDKWLRRMLINLEDDPTVAGVYGRQLPVSDSPIVQRDMMMLFGSERRVQAKDPSFSNANSMIRRDLWESEKFDEEISHFEDRRWALTILQKGYKIVYEPNAAVHHYQPDSLEKALKRFSMERDVLLDNFNG